MKGWLHSHRLRKQRSETALSFQKHESSEIPSLGPTRPLPAIPARVESAARIAASHTSSRMSIERYLSAPLEDEPASVPAISAALKRQNSQSRIPRPQGAPRGNHSRESSYDVNSEGRRTFYTSGSAPDSTGTSYSAVSRANHHQRSGSHPHMPELPKVTELDSARVQSPERPTTSRTIDTEKTWAEQMEMVLPGYSPDKRVDYKARAEEEIARIQEKAKILEDRLRRYKQERENAELLVPRLTDEMAYERIVAKPKLAWILGTDISDAKSIKRPKSTLSVAASTTDDIPDRPSTSGTLVEGSQHSHRPPRRSKSSGALDERARQAALEKRSAAAVERKPSKRPRFYCTFCQKRFHSRVEWMRHEQTIHMPEELWICCPRTGEFPDRCPFCAKSDPSPSHLADHNYLTCQAKPLSERTFNRKDFFLQHISQEHKVSPGQKPLRLAELVEAWRHPLPLKQGHQALHCGFCGLTFDTYKERTDHVAGHFMAGLDMMSWWSARVSHEVAVHKQKNPNLPQKCGYCERTYENLAVAIQQHPVCTMWSCSFLPGMQYTIYPSGTRTSLEAVCCYCNETLVKGNGKVKGAVLKEHVAQHNFRNCNQRLYFSGQRFRQHLQDNHKTNFDGTLFAGWTLLLKSSKRERPAIFEAIDDPAIRRAYTDSTVESSKQQSKKKDKEKRISQMPKMNFMDFSETPLTAAAPKKRLRRKPSVQTMPEKPEREVRESTNFFTRAATIDLAYGELATPATGARTPKPLPPQHKPGFPVSSHPVDAVNACPKFYRRRLDASTRNRLYIRDEADGPLSKNSQRLFRKVPASAFGGLVLHSTLVGATPARLTNSVDIYSLH